MTPDQPHSQSLRSRMNGPALLPELCLSLAAFRKEKPLQGPPEITREKIKKTLERRPTVPQEPGQLSKTTSHPHPRLTSKVTREHSLRLPLAPCVWYKMILQHQMTWNCPRTYSAHLQIRKQEKEKEVASGHIPKEDGRKKSTPKMR